MSAGSNGRGAAQRASESGAARLPCGSPTLDIVASVRACVLQLGAPELAICLRLLQTFQDYARSHRHWRTRPQVTFIVSSPLSAKMPPAFVTRVSQNIFCS